LAVFENGVLKKMLWHKEEEENHNLYSSSKDVMAGHMTHMRELINAGCTKFRSKYLNKRYRLEDLSVCGMIIFLNESCGNRVKGCGLDLCGENRGQ
jgi:predicted choloylglycine hydrolase